MHDAICRDEYLQSVGIKTVLKEFERFFFFIYKFDMLWTITTRYCKSLLKTFSRELNDFYIT